MLRSQLLELSLYMIGYILFIFLMIFIYKRLKNKKIAIFLITFSLIIYASIRYNVGSDYDTYLKQYSEIFYYFNNIKEIITSDVQYGFSLLMYVTKKIFSSPYAIFFIVAVIIYPFTMAIIKRNSKNFIESLFLYFTLELHLLSLNLLKQVISMTVFLKSYRNIIKNKFLSMIFYVYVMITFHISSIIPVILMFVAKFIKPTLKKMFLMIGASFILLISYKQIILNLDFMQRYHRYVLDINKEYYIVIIGAILYFIVNMFILYKLLKNKDELIKINPDNKIILSALILSIPFKVLAIDNFPIYRISVYIDQLLIFILPDLLSIYKKNMSKYNYKRFYYLYVILMIVWLCISIIFIPHNNFYEYKTIFSLGW